MKRWMVAVLLCGTSLWAGEWSAPFPSDYGTTSLSQISDIVAQVGKSTGDIPADIERIAFYQIKVDPTDFDQGMARFIQAQIEGVFTQQGHRTVVSAPELRTLRIRSTDTSFSISNTAPTMEELWKLGDRLHVDAFLEGSCSKSKENDVLVSLKVFRHRTGEQVWTMNFVAGPNKTRAVIPTVEPSLSYTLRILPVEVFKVGALSAAGSNLISSYAIEGALAEPLNPSKSAYLGVNAGVGRFLFSGGPDSASVDETVDIAHLGIELLAIFYRKPNPDDGYWLGAYAGYREFIPFFYAKHLRTLSLGYRSKLTRHFSFGAGVVLSPFERKLRGTGFNATKSITFEKIAYELTLLQYSF